MVQIVLTDADYTFDASAKTITLASPYTSLSLGQIISIVDCETNEVLYDSVYQRVDMISISGAVITHTHGNSRQADADELQITIDVGRVLSLLQSTGYDTTVTAGDYTSEATLLTIAKDTWYRVEGMSINISNFTLGATLTIKTYLAYSDSGADEQQIIETFTKVVEDPKAISLSNFTACHHWWITVESDNALDDNVDVQIPHMIVDLE
jgi:hypothetical protein